MKFMKRKLIIFVLVFLQANYLYFFTIPSLIPGETANFTNATDTLSNARLSYRAGVASGGAGASIVTIDSTGNADNDTNHLFPKDVICFAGSTLDGCTSQTEYTVANIIDTTSFNFTPPLGGTALGAADLAISTQSAIHTIAFTLANAVPTSGDIFITIPAVNANTVTNDYFPDTADTIAENGFDLGGVGTGDISVGSTTCNNNWTVTTVTPGDATNDHTILIDRHTDSCAAGSTITVTVGDVSNKLINPAPANDSSTPDHTQGVADVYTLNIKTRDGGDNTLDESNVKVAVIEGVLVSATVEETLSLTIAGTAPGSFCGLTTDVTTTATSVPWGTISNFAAFQEAAQTLTVSTNADSGYSVKVEENDQMGKDGIVCTGATAGEANSCIQDTLCDADGCDEDTTADWTDTAKYGLGYSLSGTDAEFEYGDSAGTFMSRHFADAEVPETKQQVMSNAGPVASSAVNVCYRLNVSATQPAGYYFNKIKYTATAAF
jgi:hypothetical protein